eukprot:4595059-Prymnesium_polylepis.1
MSRQFYSALPPGLQNGIDALAFPQHRFLTYVGITSGSPSTLRAAIAQVGNWHLSDTTPTPLFTHFLVQPEAPLSPPSPPQPPPAPPSPPAPPAPPPLPPLSAGDCMIVGLNDAKDFGIVLLAPLGIGQSISATDDGWSTAVTPNAFRGLESHVTHAAAADEPAGTVLRIADFTLGIDLNTFSDQLIVYQGVPSNQTFLCALDNSGTVSLESCPGSTGGWHQDACTDRTDSRGYSALPPGLTEGVDAIALIHGNNWAYAGTTVGTANELRASIAD